MVRMNSRPGQITEKGDIFGAQVMTIDAIFGAETTSKTRTIRFKQIRAVFETLTVREEITHYLKPLAKVTSSREVFDRFHFLKNESKEHFITLHLDGKNKIICIDVVSTGSLNASIVHPREVFKSCLLSSAAAVVMLHNHPSGDPTPSREDLQLTGRLKEAGELLGIKILDHIIIGDECYVSLADRGLL
jgi:DNA repair protein RadC